MQLSLERVSQSFIPSYCLRRYHAPPSHGTIRPTTHPNPAFADSTKDENSILFITRSGSCNVTLQEDIEFLLGPADTLVRHQS